MTDSELIESIRNMLTNEGTVSEIDRKHADDIIAKIAEIFINDPGKTWWWESLSSESYTIKYGRQNGLNILGHLIQCKELAYLIVTDDEPTPWAVFRGNFDEIMDLINHQRFFEYFIVSEKLDWIVFDTHHNSLVVCGSLMVKAKELDRNIEI